MNVEIGAEAALFPEKEYIKGIAVAVFAWVSLTVQCAYALVSHRSTSFGVSVTHRVD